MDLSLASCVHVSVCACAQSSLTLCDPMDCSPPHTSVHGVSQARILEWVAISFSMGSSRSRDWIHWKVDSLPLSQWCYPPNINMMHLWIPSCFNSNVTPLWILCRNLFFHPENQTSSTLHAARMKADILPPGVLLKHFVRLLWLPCSPPVIMDKQLLQLNSRKINDPTKNGPKN